MGRKALIGVLALMFAMAIGGQASAFDVHNFGCKNCHKPDVTVTGVGDGVGGNNVCLQCHIQTPLIQPIFQDGREDKSTGVFFINDRSTLTSAKGTSHNWSASDTSLAAGAKAPPTSLYYSRYNISNGKVTCSRCHDPHDDMVNPKLLRPSLKEDYCLECHNDWNLNNNNAYLTHPVGIVYATFAAANPSGYKATIDPASSIQLIQGKVYCSSCHSAHFADSDATIDGSGDSYLLRNDGIVTVLNADGITTNFSAQAQRRSNLCQSCHAYKLHGTSNPIGCLDCHSGHSYNGGTPNYFILRDRTTKPPSNVVIDNLRYLDPTNLPAHGGTKSVAAVWAGEVVGDSAGYCERCHGQLTAMPGSTLRTHQEGENCRQCHVHNGATATFEASGCDGCHGSPPRTLTQGSPDGYAYVANPLRNYSAQTFYKPETTTPHSSHSGISSGYNFNCAVCHNDDFTLTHNKNSFQDVLVPAGNFQAVVKPAGSGLNPIYSTSGSGSCSNVACHTNGGKRNRPDGTTHTYVNQTPSPVWGGGMDDIPTGTCNICHGNTAASMAVAQRNNSESHIAHLNKNYSCNVCHKDTAASSTALVVGAAGVKHVNGIPDVAFAAGGTYIKASGTCSVTCHGSSTPDWDIAATGACGACHQYSVAGVATGTGTALGGAHAKHVYTADGGLQLTCTTCHTNNGSGAEHVNGTDNLITNFQSTVCNPCHGATAIGTGNDQSPNWANPATVYCSTCHAGVLAFIPGGQTVAPTSGIHAAARISANPHDNSFNNGNGGTADCKGCHTDRPSSAHANGIFNNSWPAITIAATVGFLDDVSTPTCAPTSGMSTCHDDGGAWKRKWSPTAGNSDGTECANCHGDFGPSGFVAGMALRHQTTSSGDGDGQVAASHNDGTDKCYFCHGYKAGSASYYDFAVKHRNGSIEVNTNVGWNDYGATVGCTNCHSTNNQQTIDEHHGFEDTTSRWARTLINGPVADCNSCHTINGMTHTGTNESSTVHTLHVGATPPLVSGCTDCHSNSGSGSEHNNTTVNFANKLTSANNYARAANYGGTCAGTNGCHDSEAGEWSAGNLGADACIDCHAAAGILGQGGYPPVSAKHTKHINSNAGVPGDCSDCHGANAASGNHAGHTNGAKTVVAAGSKISAYTAGDGTCTNTCHLVVNGRDWTSGTVLACADCHAAGVGKSLNQGGWPPVSNGHPKHIGTALNAAYGDTVNHSITNRYEFGCGACHGSTAAAHIDGSNTIAGTGWNSGGKTCNATYCHSGLNAGNVRAYAITPAWNTTFVGDPCAACHGNSPASGAHIEHQVGFHYNSVYTGIKDFLPVRDSDPLPAGLVLGVNGRDQLRGHGGLLNSNGTPTSTTITCYICHNDTVTTKFNDRNPVCASCHNGTAAPFMGNAAIADMSKHVNGAVEVQFVNEKIRSKAQVRNNVTAVPELSNNWTRINLYKKNDGSSYDEQPATLRTLAGTQGGWNGIGKSCQISCHLWESGRVDKYPAQWNGGAITCTDCHTRLPK